MSLLFLFTGGFGAATVPPPERLAVIVAQRREVEMAAPAREISISAASRVVPAGQ